MLTEFDIMIRVNLKTIIDTVFFDPIAWAKHDIVMVRMIEVINVYCQLAVYGIQV